MARQNTTTNASTSAAVESTKNVRVDGTHVISTIEVRKSRDSKAHTFVVDLDFDGITETQLLLWAARTKIIDLQRAIRACDEQFIADLAKQGTIRRMAVDAGTGFVESSKVRERITTQFKGLTPEARAELLEMLQNM